MNSSFFVKSWDCEKVFWKIAALCRDDWASKEEDFIKFEC